MRMPAFVLPVSGLCVILREPTGWEDLLLAEGRADDPALALALAQRLGRAEPDCDWAELPVHDIDTLIARLRQALIGDRVIADTTCGAAACGQRVDLSFDLGAYLAHHRPHAPRGRGWAAKADHDATGWYCLTAPAAAMARFRLPTLGDQMAVDGVVDQAALLAQRCIAPAGMPGRLVRRVEAAMQAMAPVLAGPLQGQCPECGASIQAWFNLRLYCLSELSLRARYVLDDIDILAERYHWSERAILRLPRARREHYAERARLARAA
jgi:hypothetical protein